MGMVLGHGSDGLWRPGMTGKKQQWGMPKPYRKPANRPENIE